MLSAAQIEGANRFPISVVAWRGGKSPLDIGEIAANVAAKSLAVGGSIFAIVGNVVYNVQFDEATRQYTSKLASRM